MPAYTVEAGDSYWSLAQKWGISWIDLLRLNGFANPGDAQGPAGHLSVGQNIEVTQDVWDTHLDPNPTDTAEEDDPYDWEPEDVEFEQPEGYEDLLSDSAFSSFMATYNLGLNDINTVRATQGLNLRAAMTRQFGGKIDESENPFTVDTAREWSEGTWGISKDRALESSINKFAGLGMGFGGGTAKSTGEITTDYDTQRADSFAEDLATRDQLNTNQSTAFLTLEQQRIAQEAAAGERQASGTYI